MNICSTHYFIHVLLVDVMNDVRVCVSKSVCMFAIERWIVIECISNAVERLLLDCWTNKMGLGQFVTLRNFPFLLRSFHFRVLPSRWLFISFDTMKPYHKINNITWTHHTFHCNIDVFSMLCVKFNRQFYAKVSVHFI